MKYLSISFTKNNKIVFVFVFVHSQSHVVPTVALASLAFCNFAVYKEILWQMLNSCHFANKQSQFKLTFVRARNFLVRFISVTGLVAIIQSECCFDVGVQIFMVFVGETRRADTCLHHQNESKERQRRPLQPIEFR